MTRNTCKLILVLLVCAVPLVAAVVGAEPNSRPYGELYALAATEQGTTQKDDAKRSETGGAAAQVGEKSAVPAGAVGLGAEEGPSGSANSLSNIERGWILVVAGLGLLLSLAAAGYVTWSRARQIEPPATVLLPRGLPHASNNPASRPAADEQTMPERRAA
jgi:hypothetical protein